MVKRLKTGIEGFDKLIEGGFPEKSVILVSGGPGTGKTTFGLQFIYYGATHNEPGIFVSFEQEPQQIKESMMQFGMDFEKLEKEKKALVMRLKDTKDVSKVLEAIEEKAKEMNAKRIVIDSLTSMEVFAPTYSSINKDLPLETVTNRFAQMPPPEMIIRRLMYEVIDELKEKDFTTIITSEVVGENMYSKYGVAEFVVDGLIVLHYSSIGQKKFGNIEVKKMRETKHIHGVYDYTMDENGIKVVIEHGPTVLMK
ncbi:MAG: AAA family ATPase [Candidatus Micrarchaeota archaeon]|nr:AAA family ATPase [Candidatus Micrarchaeota archaeon]